MNISNLLTVSTAVAVAVAGTYFSSRNAEPAAEVQSYYYFNATDGCNPLSTALPSGCGASGSAICTVSIDGLESSIYKASTTVAQCHASNILKRQ